MREAFTDQIAELPAGVRVTGRLWRYVAGRVAGGLAVSVAGGGLLSWPVTHAAWVHHAREMLAEPAPVVVLGIDQTRRAGPFSTSHPFASYRAAVREALPSARIGADQVHLVCLANQAVTDVRRRVTWDSHGRCGRKADPAWAARWRLLRGPERLSPAQFTKMWNDLMDGDSSTAILTAWIAKEELRALLAANRWAAARHRTPPTPIQQLVRPVGAARARASRRHHRGLVARGPGVPADRCHQRRDRSHQPHRQDRRPHRLRVPQPGQPTTTSTARLHPTITSGHRPLR